jgi:arylsulfatase A-like enzyme
VLAVAAVGAWLSFRAASAPTSVAVAIDAGLTVAAPEDDADAARLPPDRPNILLFTIDTLRADHVGTSGYPRDTTPTIDALAARGARFTRAYSTSNWTLPAVASLMSGVLPSEHGDTHSRVTREDGARQDFLSASLPSLPQMLHDVGYRTIGVTANTHLLGEAGFARGFDDYECTSFVTTRRARPAVLGRLDALRDGAGPWFLWVHVTDPHATYIAREPRFSAWWDPSRPRHPLLERTVFLTGIGPAAAASGIPVEQALAYVTAAYDSEIRATDDFLEELLTELDDGNLAVVVTADHGEELNDHHMMGHGLTLFEEVARVPLVIALPQGHASVVDSPVSIIDVLPTVAEIADASATGVAGISLAPAVHGAALPVRDVFLESSLTAPIQAIVCALRVRRAPRSAPARAALRSRGRSRGTAAVRRCASRDRGGDARATARGARGRGRTSAGDDLGGDRDPGRAPRAPSCARIRGGARVSAAAARRDLRETA